MSRRPIEQASGPLRRTTPIPPRPGGVAIATMVSEVENITATVAHHNRTPQRTTRKTGGVDYSDTLPVKLEFRLSVLAILCVLPILCVLREVYFRNEISTVFVNASPM